MTRLWLIACDRCGKESTPGPSRQAVLDGCRKDGWHLRGHTRTADICPDCWARSAA